MYRSPLDSLTDLLADTVRSLTNLREALDRVDGLSEVAGARLAAALEQASSNLSDELNVLQDEAETTRASYAVDRAWQLLRLHEVGALDRTGYYELAEYTPASLHEAFDFPETLRERLLSKDVIEGVLHNTHYSLALKGHFVD